MRHQNIDWETWVDGDRHDAAWRRREGERRPLALEGDAAELR